MKITPVHKAIMQSRRRQSMQDAQMNAWKNWANKRNTYDDAYVLGYGAGYHKDKYVNSYDKDTEAQYWIKFKHGYTAGKLMRVKEERVA